MRLWSLHPKYLDKAGLGAVWREGLLAQSCLIKGEYSKCPECDGGLLNTLKLEDKFCKKCKNGGILKTAYYHHPQLERFKEADYPIRAIGEYLTAIWEEAKSRGYKYNAELIEQFYRFPVNQMTVTIGQLEYEWRHLENKLDDRHSQIQFDKNCQYINTSKNIIEPHPLFRVIEGEIESWEKIK